MSGVRPAGPRVEAIFVSDLHLRHTPPAARCSEPDWYATQAGYLNQIWRLSESWDDLNPPPVICAGDLFHKWNPPIELVNFAIREIPHLFCVPGQHDLPNHRYEDRHKSAYGTLVEAGKIHDLKYGQPFEVRNLRLWGFPWGCELHPLPEEKKTAMVWDVAVVHRYLWRDGKSFPGAPQKNNVEETRKRLRGFDVAVFGDNHVPFVATKRSPVMVNCGGFMRSNVDQRGHRPRVYLLKSDLTVEPHYLDVSKDVLTDPDEAIRNLTVKGKPLMDVIDTLMSLGSDALSYEEAVERFLLKHKVRDGVRRVIASLLEEVKR